MRSPVNQFLAIYQSNEYVKPFEPRKLSLASFIIRISSEC